VFEGLLPEPHNKIIMDLLFIMAHWHGLAKLRMHSDLTLAILDQQTTDLGAQFREFKATVCAAYSTQELDREVDARSRRQTRDAAKRTETGKAYGVGRGIAARTNAKGKQKASAEHLQHTPLPRQPRRKKSFNLQTYKFHALGDYVTSIRHFGTTDSYSTEPVSHDALPVLLLTQLLFRGSWSTARRRVDTVGLIAEPLFNSLLRSSAVKHVCAALNNDSNNDSNNGLLAWSQTKARAILSYITTLAKARSLTTKSVIIFAVMQEILL
jgi:hypothetical protein